MDQRLHGHDNRAAVIFCARIRKPGCPFAHPGYKLTRVFVSQYGFPLRDAESIRMRTRVEQALWRSALPPASHLAALPAFLSPTSELPKAQLNLQCGFRYYLYETIRTCTSFGSREFSVGRSARLHPNVCSYLHFARLVPSRGPLISHKRSGKRTSDDGR